MGLLARAIVYRQTGWYDEAVSDIKRALHLIHPKKDADLHYKALHNLTLALLFGKRDAESLEAAMRTFDEVRDLLRKHRITKRSSQYGQLLHAQGLANKLAGAEERAQDLFRKSQKVFFEIKNITDWLRVSLDLIELNMHHQRWGHVKVLANEMTRYANDTETIAAVRAFLEAVKSEPLELTSGCFRSSVRYSKGLAPELLMPGITKSLRIRGLRTMTAGGPRRHGPSTRGLAVGDLRFGRAREPSAYAGGRPRAAGTVALHTAFRLQPIQGGWPDPWSKRADVGAAL